MLRSGRVTAALLLGLCVALGPCDTAVLVVDAFVFGDCRTSSSLRSGSSLIAATDRFIQRRREVELGVGRSSSPAGGSSSRSAPVPTKYKNATDASSSRGIAVVTSFRSASASPQPLDDLLREQWEGWYDSGDVSWGETPPPPLKPREPSGQQFQEQQMLERQQQEKYRMLALLWAIACLSALDRVAMSVALLPMSEELGFLTDTVKGCISSFFSAGYGLAIVPAGLLVSQASPRTVMAVGLAVWSFATLATPETAQSWEAFPAGLLVARALVGAGESVIVPALQRLLVSWTTAAEKATALAAVYSGFHAGTIAAYVVSPWLLENLPQDEGWRGLFHVYGAAGLCMLVPWCLWAQDRPCATKTGRDSDVAGALANTTTNVALSVGQSWEAALQTLRDAPWSGLVRSKAAWALLLAHCAKNWGLYNALAWTPTFYAEQYHIGVQESSWLSVLPSITGAICVVTAGTSADALFQWFDGQPNHDSTDDVRALVRKAFQTVAFVGQGVVLATLAWHIPEDASTAQAFLMAAFGLMAFNAAGFESGIQEKAGEKWAGLLYSVTSLPAVLMGTMGVYATGRILDATQQDWSYVYGLNAAVNVLGAVAFVALYNSKREFD